MRITPVINKSNYTNKFTKSNTQFERKENVMPLNKKAHKYTGVVSADLAYASMFDYKIARELKLMGLI